MRLFLIAFLFAHLFLLISCQKPAEEPTPQPTPADKLFQKEWVGEKMVIDGTPPAPAAPINQEVVITDARLNFKSDKTYTAKFAQAATAQAGNWAMLENYTKLQLTGGFKTALTDQINLVLAGITLPAGTSITSIVIPEVFDVKTLNDTNLGFKGVIVVNLSITIGVIVIPYTLSLNVEFFFKH